MPIVEKIEILGWRESAFGRQFGRISIYGCCSHDSVVLSMLTTDESHEADLKFVRSLSGLFVDTVIDLLYEHERYMSTINLTCDPATFGLSDIRVSEIVKADSTAITWDKNDIHRMFTECLFGPGNKYLFITETQSVVFNCDSSQLFDSISQCKSAAELVDVIYDHKN